MSCCKHVTQQNQAATRLAGKGNHIGIMHKHPQVRITGGFPVLLILMTLHECSNSVLSVMIMVIV